MAILGTPLDIERKPFFEWLMCIFFLVVLGYFLLVCAYTAAAIVAAGNENNLAYRTSKATLTQVVLASNIRSTFPAFLKNFGRGEEDILRLVQKALEKKPFIPIHTAINLGVFAVLGFVSSQLSLFASTLVVPIALFVTTFGLIQAEVLQAQVQPTYTVFFILFIQLFAIYATAVVVKWIKLG